jgi:glutathione S-transferase
MITVHHLNDSRSQRILWLLEELGVPYEIQRYERDSQTRLSPPSLKAVHALGKSPVITDGGLAIAESGAIIDYIIRHRGGGRLQPLMQSARYDEYVQWLHYAEGSAIFPLLLKLYVGRLGDAGRPLWSRIDSEAANHLSYIDRALAGKHYLLGEDFTAADVQLSFVGEFAASLQLTTPYANLTTWVARFQARAAYRSALAKGGPYRFATQI